jgi:UDP-GlcNAc3NAcA epimerase
LKSILTVIGARPQFIKASVVSKVIEQTVGLREIVVHTGQHFDANMSDVFFAELGMGAPKHHLGIGGGRHGEMTGRMLSGIEEILVTEQPDVVLVYGDTNSTLAGALAAAKLHIPVAHVEAGLRSFNLRMPEEINRILTDRISRWLFTPTEIASKHLRAEGISENQIIEVGDVMYDVALNHGDKVHADERVLKRLNLPPKSYVLVTVHRAENTDDPNRLAVIVDALKKVAESLPVIWPLHPRTRLTLEKSGILPIGVPHLHLIEPVGYLDMVQLEKYTSVIATDSGGVQKEAFFHGVPCVTLRDETEWVELVEAGWNRLAAPTSIDSVSQLIAAAIGSQGQNIRPYGNGKAAKDIVSVLLQAPFEGLK